MSSSQPSQGACVRACALCWARTRPPRRCRLRCQLFRYLIFLSLLSRGVVVVVVAAIPFSFVSNRNYCVCRSKHTCDDVDEADLSAPSNSICTYVYVAVRCATANSKATSTSTTKRRRVMDDWRAIRTLVAPTSARRHTHSRARTSECSLTYFLSARRWQCENSPHSNWIEQNQQ